MTNGQTQTYEIRMDTQIGPRFGRLTVLTRVEKLSGYLDILRHTEPFEGTIDGNGNCEFAGKIVTLIRTVSYIATGTITPDALCLSLTGDKSIFKITGTAR
ncbi:MAG: hypothetical protein VB092_07230 [Oscillospiraceae bacterium]|nr:hypothetical protein [Oscillospiraceae bacterium]